MALDIFLARPGQQLYNTIEETLKTLSYQFHPAGSLLCVSQVMAFEVNRQEFGLWPEDRACRHVGTIARV